MQTCALIYDLVGYMGQLSDFAVNWLNLINFHMNKKENHNSEKQIPSR